MVRKKTVAEPRWLVRTDFFGGLGGWSGGLQIKKCGESRDLNPEQSRLQLRSVSVTQEKRSLPVFGMRIHHAGFERMCVHATVRARLLVCLPCVGSVPPSSLATRADVKFSGWQRATGGQKGGIGGIRRPFICLGDSRGVLFASDAWRQSAAVWSS